VRRLFPEAAPAQGQRERPAVVRPPDPLPGAAGAVSLASVRDRRTQLLRARIHEVARRLGVHPMIGEAVARVESNLDPSARSPDGRSLGAFQMKRPTALEMRRRLGRDRPGLPLADEVTLGIGYLRYLDQIFARPTVLDQAGRRTLAVADPRERSRFAIAAYNAGEGAVAAAQRQAAGAGRNPLRFREVHPYLPPVTQRYVTRVLATAHALGMSDEGLAAESALGPAR
jgi:soluble lytic murein transglycosylase-like protein